VDAAKIPALVNGKLLAAVECGGDASRVSVSVEPLAMAVDLGEAYPTSPLDVPGVEDVADRLLVPGLHHGFGVVPRVPRPRTPEPIEAKPVTIH
jgi:hypothetical protein